MEFFTFRNLSEDLKTGCLFSLVFTSDDRIELICFLEFEISRTKMLNNASENYLLITHLILTLPTAEILSGKNVRAWVSMVLYLKK